MGGSFGIDDYFQETDGDEADDEFDQITMASGCVGGGDGASTETGRPQMLLSVPPQVMILAQCDND